MPTMKANEIRDLSEAEIRQRIAEEQRDLTDLRFRRSVTGLENPIVLRDKRREVARLKTILTEKKASGETEA
jgi:large subunit ribosomal protein L29